MERLNTLLLLHSGLLVYASAISDSCFRVYDGGGAPAVFESPDCPEWVLSPNPRQNPTPNCPSASIQGRRQYQEDRVVCNLNMQIPLVGEDATKNVTVGVAAIFDGHGGTEASELASKLLLDYLRLHATFYMYHRMMPNQKHYDPAPGRVNTGDTMEMQILKEALLRAIRDINYTFLTGVVKENFFAGSTATVVLMVDGQILVANVGDSKAFICSHGNTEVIELTEDHHPDRHDERARIETAGGYVSEVGVPRLVGVLTMSRAIGDYYLRRYGLIAEPEVTGWLPLNANNRYLVASSDGIFESLSHEDVCHILQDPQSKCNSSSSSSSSVAECIVNTAFDKGSGDNLSVIIIPLASDEVSQNILEGSPDGVGEL